jgi:glutaryl-CoA dehydrogenase
MTADTETDIGRGLGTDYLLLRQELTDDELDYLERTRRFVDEDVLPVMAGYWERAEVPLGLVRRLGGLGLVGIRHMGDIEAIHTFEGTEIIQTWLL